MIHLTLIDQEGNAITPDKLVTIADLRETQDRARSLIRECERLLDQMIPKKAGTGVPYA